jgi:hypothetical protein
MDQINPGNVSSPISPASPLNPVTSVEATPIVSDAPLSPVQEMTPTVSTTQTSTSKDASAPSAESTTSTQATPQVSVPKGKALVPGFGLVMSLEVLNNPIQMQQEQTLSLLLEYQQELPYELRGNQNLLLQFISDTDVVDTWNRAVDAVNGRLLRYNEVQPDY